MNVKNMKSLLKAEDSYYHEEHRVMWDQGDGHQVCQAMCRDEETAKELAELLTIKSNLETVLDNGDDGSIVGQALILAVLGGDE